MFQRPQVVVLEHSHALSIIRGPHGAASAPQRVGTEARWAQPKVFAIWALERKQVTSSREETKVPSGGGPPPHCRGGLPRPQV